MSAPERLPAGAARDPVWIVTGRPPTGELIRVRGLVQGVGFRPTVWRIANACGLTGEVLNDGEGVLIRAWGVPSNLDRFCRQLRAQCPPLARIDVLERAPLGDPAGGADFRIVESQAGEVHTGVVADAATCSACRRELFDPADRRYRYPFINCTHCGPRLSIVERIPYDRSNTSMAPFRMCPECQAEYEDPADRRFHAQPNACPVCGPRVWLQDPAGGRLEPRLPDSMDAVAAASRLLSEGRILAVKGIGGFHLACDACNAGAVAELRRRKRRFAKPFALMGRDLGVIRRYCRVNEEEAALLRSTAAPIVLLEADGPEEVAADVVPGQNCLGFMLPYSPLHHLLLADWDRPLVMTSGNLSEEPQCVDNLEAVARLGSLADILLLHDRAIVNRVDDSVVRVMDGAPRLLRRARGYAPATILLPQGFAERPPILALGGELKNTICLVQGGRAVLSQHLGDLEDARTAREYERTISLYRDLFRLEPRVLAVDLHPDYRSTRLGQERAARDGADLAAVQHHHAHIAAVLLDNGWPLEGGQVLGIALDGLGYGDDGAIWGGELLRADYRGFERLAWLKPTPMPGGVKAIMEPWRNTYAHLRQHLGWKAARARYGQLELFAWLGGKSLGVLERMIQAGINAPMSSSCGRLFDAVAAALGICREGISYEGQAAVELEAVARQAWPLPGGYPFAIAEGAGGTRLLDPAPMWASLLDDLAARTGLPLAAARFHRGLADALVELARELASGFGLEAVALSGGVFQNRTLFEAVSAGLRRRGLQVLAHRQVPTHDGSLALGQAAVALARELGDGF
jgi:hydrogenase maturation protein HypF